MALSEFSTSSKMGASEPLPHPRWSLLSFLPHPRWAPLRLLPRLKWALPSSLPRSRCPPLVFQPCLCLLGIQPAGRGRELSSVHLSRGRKDSCHGPCPPLLHCPKPVPLHVPGPPFHIMYFTYHHCPSKTLDFQIHCFSVN